jgi:archaemetzincin
MMNNLKCILLFILFPLSLFQFSNCQRNDNTNNGKSLIENRSFTFDDFKKLAPLHTQLGEPQVNDWLFDHPEKGQSYFDYCARKPFCPNDSMNKIYILPIGIFNKMEQKLIENTAEYVGIFFSLKVKLLDPVPDNIVPKKYRRMNFGIEQLQTKYILQNILVSKMPKQAICFISLTNKDLFPDENWNFVFGQANWTNRTGVSSFFRYSCAGLDSINYLICLERTIKTTSHEICHMFALKHCPIYQCLINGANSMEETDNKPLWLCPECLAKLQWCIKFDLIKRYDYLIDYFDRTHFEKEKLFYLKSKLLMCKK